MFYTRGRNTPRTYGRQGRGATGRRGGVRAIVTHRGPTADGAGGARAIVTHHRLMTGGRTYDRGGGCLKKEDKYASSLMLHQTPDRAVKNRTVRPKSGRMATLSNAPLHILSNGNGVATREK